MVETRRLTQLLDRVAARVRLPQPPLVLALSGGADSAALAHLAGRETKDLRALHIDHGLPASSQMRKAAAAIADALEIPLQIVEVEVPAGASPEGQARRVRYGAFEEATRGETLLTGHTMDDQAETVLMNLIRGAGPRGLSGIPPLRPPNIHRPLLGVSRKETHEIASLAGLGFVADPMNHDISIRRNAIRLEVIPALRRYNPQLTEALARLAESMRIESGYLDGVSELGSLVDEGTAVIPNAELIVRPRALAVRGVLNLARSMGKRLTSDDVEDLFRVANGETPSAQLSAGVDVAIEEALLVLRTRADVEAHETTDVLPLSPGTHELGRFEYEVDLVPGVCRVAPIGAWRAVFPKGVELVATLRDSGKPVVLADGEAAWLPGERRLPIAFYEPGATDYLSVLAREKSGWT